MSDDKTIQSLARLTGTAPTNERNYLRLHLKRYLNTINLIRNLKASLALDIGTGYGHLAFLLKEKLGCYVVGTDTLVPSRPLLNEFSFIKSTCVPFRSNCFDVVCACEVMSTPNAMRPTALLGRSIRFLTGSRHIKGLIPDHVKELNPSEVTVLLERTGYRLLELKVASCLSNIQHFHLPLGWISLAVNRIIAKISAILGDTILTKSSVIKA